MLKCDDQSSDLMNSLQCWLNIFRASCYQDSPHEPLLGLSPHQWLKWKSDSDREWSLTFTWASPCAKYTYTHNTHKKVRGKPSSILSPYFWRLEMWNPWNQKEVNLLVRAICCMHLVWSGLVGGHYHTLMVFIPHGPKYSLLQKH